MLIQLCYEKSSVTTTDLVEWLISFTRKANKHHRGFESQTLVSLFLFVEEIDCLFLFSCVFFFFMTVLCIWHMLMRPIYFIQYRYSKDVKEISAAEALRK